MQIWDVLLTTILFYENLINDLIQDSRFRRTLIVFDDVIEDDWIEKDFRDSESDAPKNAAGKFARDEEDPADVMIQASGGRKLWHFSRRITIIISGSSS